VENLLTLESLNPDKKLSVFLAIKFAEKVLPIWEAHQPKDNRPRAAIEAAQAWLNNPSDTTAARAAHATADAAAAYAGASDAWSAAGYNADWAWAASAARAAYAAVGAADADADDDAAWAADNALCANNTADTVYAAWATNAAGAAANALRKNRASFVHSVLMENAGVILEHMVKEEEICSR
jgi:hypothetical protein